MKTWKGSDSGIRNDTEELLICLIGKLKQRVAEMNRVKVTGLEEKAVNRAMTVIYAELHQMFSEAFKETLGAPSPYWLRSELSKRAGSGLYRK